MTGTVLAGRRQPLRMWAPCLCFMGLDASGTQAMTEQLRRGLVAKALAVELAGEVEINEVYVVAAPGPFGVATRPLDAALDDIAAEPRFWTNA